MIFGLRFTYPQVPGALVLVVGGLLASALLDLGEAGVALVGNVPSGLPSVVLPDTGYISDNIQAILTAATALLLIGFSQTAGDARAFASKHRYQVDINQESVAQGVANAGSGMIQGIPVSASLSASSLNDETGARTPLASLTTGAVVVLTLLFLAPVFSDLPKPVLSALIIEAVVMGMMNVAGMERLFRVKRSDFWIAAAALLGVLSAGVLVGVIIGVILSIGWLVYVSAFPEMPVLGRQPGGQAFRSISAHSDYETYPGMLVLGFDAGLFFVDSDALEDRLRTLSGDSDPDLEVIVIDFEGVNYMDSQGSGTISKLVSLARSYGIELRLARVKPQALDIMRLDGVVDEIGEADIYNTVYEAAEDHIQSSS